MVLLLVNVVLKSRSFLRHNFAALVDPGLLLEEGGLRVALGSAQMVVVLGGLLIQGVQVSNRRLALAVVVDATYVLLPIFSRCKRSLLLVAERARLHLVRATHIQLALWHLSFHIDLVFATHLITLSWARVFPRSLVANVGKVPIIASGKRLASLRIVVRLQDSRPLSRSFLLLLRLLSQQVSDVVAGLACFGPLDWLWSD